MSTAGNLQRPNSRESNLWLSDVPGAVSLSFHRINSQHSAATPRQINRISLKKDFEVSTNG